MMLVQNPCKVGPNNDRYKWSYVLDPYEWPQKRGNWGYNPCTAGNRYIFLNLKHIMLTFW